MLAMLPSVVSGGILPAHREHAFEFLSPFLPVAFHGRIVVLD
jgi:hypothetical protein